MAASSPATPPVTPRPELLPLKDLRSWESFESFCCDLLNHIHPERPFAHYGKRGDTQHGIDLLGRGQDGSHWVAQCKKYEHFTSRHAKEALEAMSFKADRYLLLISDEATAGVRDVIHEVPSWELWDVRDISRQVRDLPLHKARKLVEHHFGPDWRKHFLGLSGDSDLLSPSDYFARQLDTQRLFHQAWTLVGRENLLEALDDLLLPTHEAALLSGRGGIGKTKLLYEWSRKTTERSPETRIFFIDAQRPLSREAFDELPAGACILVVDDAHSAQDLSTLLAIARKCPQLKLLLSCRPQALDELRSRLSRADFDLRRTMLLEVPPLSKGDVLTLARQGLGEGSAHLAEELAAISADSPLVTVVGARLVSEQGFAPRLLSGNADFQQLLLRRFEEIIVGKVSSRVERRLCQRLLELLSVLSPFDPEDAFLPQQAWEFLRLDEETFRDAVDALVEAGALLRTGNHLRVTPDLLAEHLLEKACIDSGRSTGYAEKVFDQFAGLSPETLMRNLSALSWRLRETGEEPPGFLSGPWSKLKHILATGSNSDRRFILRLVVAAAYHEPQRALECVEQLFHTLYAQRVDASTPLPPELQKSAFTALWLVLEASDSLASRCVDLLWQVGRDDPRKLDTYSMGDHGVGVLFQLARYSPEQPPNRYDFILDAIERWLEDPDVFDHVHTPFPLFEAILKKQINLSFHDGDEFDRKPFFADATQMGPVRRRALALVQRCVRSGRPRIVQEAADCLRRALRPPNTALDEDAQGPEQWIPEQLEIIQMLEQLATEYREPFYRCLLVNALYPAITEALDARVFERALAFISSVPDDFDLRLARVLSFDFLGDRVGSRDIPAEVSARWPSLRQILPDVVKAFHKRFPDPIAGHEFLQERLSFIAQVPRPSGSEGEFLEMLARLKPSYAQAFCEHVLAQEQTRLHRPLPEALRVLRQLTFPWFHATARKLMASGKPQLREFIARSYASAGMELSHPDKALEHQEEELHTLRELLQDEEPAIRNYTVFWLNALGPARDAWLVEVLSGFVVGEDGSLASNLCGVLNALHQRGGLPPEYVATFLRKLVPIRSFPPGSIQRFLKEQSGRTPSQVFDLVLCRIQHLEDSPATGFQPFPLERSRPEFVLELAGNAHAASFLQAVLDRMPGASVTQRRWLALLFNALSSDCSSLLSLAFIQEQAHTADASTLDSLASVLSHASVDFILNQFELTCTLIERARALGEPCRRNLNDKLLNRAVRGLGEGDWHSSVPRGEERRERAVTLRNRLRLGSPAWPFYTQFSEELAEQQ
jgi:hypothetical protein